MRWTSIAAIFLALGVGFGAFGAHLLQGRLDNYSMTIWERAVMYHFFHALGLLAVPVMARVGLISSRAAEWTCWLLAIGIVLFAGSLYVLALSGERLWGAVTPFGGVSMIAAWLVLALGAARQSREGSTHARNVRATIPETDVASNPAVSPGVR